MKHYIKRDKTTPHKCSEPCPFINKDIPTIKWEHSGVRIGSGFCQTECKHHKNNNMIEKYGKDYDVSLGGVVWIECDKLDSYFKHDTNKN